jgi:SAM-dependent methyltransferase
MVRVFLRKMKRCVPGLERLVNRYRTQREGQRFAGSADYWQARYASGQTSGPGSYGDLAQNKASFLNTFVKDHSIESVIEFGCGDGNQLGLMEYPRYIGLDVSQAAIDRCRAAYASDPTKSFILYEPERFEDEHRDAASDLSLSLDVIYHLVEDSVFEAHLRHVFLFGRRSVIIYSSNTNDQLPNQRPHVRHRKFTDFIEQNISGWTLREVVPNPYEFNGDFGTSSLADFYVYERDAST